MLKRLWVKNYALIKDAEIIPDNGLNVITGETGAGKSILLGALGLVLGERSDHSSIGFESEKCIIEAEFYLNNLDMIDFFHSSDLDYDDHTLIRREISKSGKSRSFVNDTPVSLSILKELGEKLIQIHTQHTGIEIIHPKRQMALLDDYSSNQEILKNYKSKLIQYKKYTEDLNLLNQRITDWQKEKDYYQFLFDELEQFKPIPQEEELLLNEIQLLSKATDIKEFESFATYLLTEAEDSIAVKLMLLRNKLRALDISENSQAKGIFDIIERTIWEMKELSPEIEKWASSNSNQPEKLELLNARLAEMQQLFKKHRVENSLELLAVMGDLKAKLQIGLNYDNEIAQLKNEIIQKEIELIEIDTELYESRKKHAAALKEQTLKWLKSIQMEHAHFQIEVEKNTEEFRTHGRSEVKFLFSANKGKPIQPLAKVASGGEISRLNFALQTSLAGVKSLPTLIFDEIDTGISGEVAVKMGEMMQHLGKNHQILAITHLPQVAARGKSHFHVYKEMNSNNTLSHIKRLTDRERLEEIAMMLGGKNVSEASIAAAQELLLK